MNGYESRSSRLGTANIMLSIRNVGETLYQELRGISAKCSGGLRFRRKSKVEEGHLMPDHVHMLLSIPPEIRGVAGGRVSSRARARSTWLGFMASANAISWGSISGPGDLRSTRSGATRKPSAPTSAIKRRKIKAGADEPLALTRRLGRLRIQGAASATPSRRFDERLQS